tara:strand:- start:1365 stop:1586 length:222 start_codon:yes stop_codon:yes gene_type:complete
MSSLKWFGPKRVGWGIRPTHPMGWIVLTVSLVAFVIGIHLITSGSSTLAGILVSSLSIIFLLIVTSLSYCKSR